MIKEKLQKAKNYVVEHKTGFMIAGGSLLLGVGAALGWTGCLKKLNVKPGDVLVADDRIVDFLLSSADKYNKSGCRGYTLKSDEPIKVEALGELGKAMTEAGATAKDGFTHFLAFGPKSE